jgi:hypothetical protein
MQEPHTIAAHAQQREKSFAWIKPTANGIPHVGRRNGVSFPVTIPYPICFADKNKTRLELLPAASD